MKLRDFCSFYAQDGLFLPVGSYTVEELTPQQMESILKTQNKKSLASQNYSYPSHKDHKLLK